MPTFNPALSGMNQSPYQGFLGAITGALGTRPGMNEEEIQREIQMRKRGIQRDVKLGSEQWKRYMGGKGFRGGESGIADVGYQQLFRAGQERAGQATQEVRSEAAQRRFQEQMQLGGLALGGGQLALTGEEGALNRLMQLYGMRQTGEMGRWQPYWSGMSNLYAGGGGY